MANRMYTPLKGSLTPGVTCLTGNWLFGGSGAVTVSATGFSVGTLGASDGLQTVTLDDKYNELLAVHITSIADASWGADEAIVTELTGEDVNGDRTISLRYTKNSTGSVSPATLLDGRKVLCMIWLKNSGL